MKLFGVSSRPRPRLSCNGDVSIGRLTRDSRVNSPNGKSQTTSAESYPSSNKMRRFPIGMKPISLLMLVVSVLSARFLPSYSHAPVSPLLGVHPLDEKHYEGEMIECRDSSRFFSRNRLNDDFCDCLDGTDEPGTAACPLGKFYCKNLGSMPKFIPSSHVNDRVCDCCDGSDEYGGSIKCPNTCIMGGNVEYKLESHDLHTQTSVVDRKEKENSLKFEDLLPKVKGLKTVITLQVVLVCLLLILCLCRRQPKGKRRRYRASAGYIIGS